MQIIQLKLTELGIVKLPVNPVQPLNALLPIEVTELPIVKVPLSPVQSLNALYQLK